MAVPAREDEPVVQKVERGSSAAADSRVIRRSRRVPTDPRHRSTHPVSPPNPVSVNRMLWILLALSTAFLGGVQIYVGRGGGTVPVAGQVAEVPVLHVISPVLPVRGTDLTLSWDQVPGAFQYHLRIHAIQGTPVVDPMPVWGEQWRPSAELLPGLSPGTYRWTVEGIDGAERVLARSLPTEITIR